jgi:hypothetical protein
MIPHHLIHEHHEALLDAAHQGALLNLESLERFSRHALASRRRWLDATRPSGEQALFAWRPQPAAHMATPPFDEARFWMEIAGEAYARWIELCETQWRRTHDRVRSACAWYADWTPSEFSLAMALAQRANDLATDSAERMAEGSKAVVAEAVDEIASVLPDASAAPDEARKTVRARAKRPKTAD